MTMATPTPTQNDIVDRLRHELRTAEATRDYWISMARDYRQRVERLERAESEHIALDEAAKGTIGAYRERAQKAEAELAISRAKHKQLIDSMREVLKPEDGESLREALDVLIAERDTYFDAFNELSEWALNVASPVYDGESEVNFEELCSYIEECVNAYRRTTKHGSELEETRAECNRWKARVLELERRREAARKALDGGVK